VPVAVPVGGWLDVGFVTVGGCDVWVTCAWELGGATSVSASAALVDARNALSDTLPPRLVLRFNRTGARRVPFPDNVGVTSLDTRIDDLYQQPLDAFIEARTALAKSLTGDAAKRVRSLAKPTVVPWAVNQVFWRARPTYDAVIKSGERLRKAQIAALEGRMADLRGTSDAHRRALAEAVKEAERLSARSGSKPSPDALMRTFEALSLAAERPDAPGRLTRPLQPAGFEALGGVALKAPPEKKAPIATAVSTAARRRDEAARRKEEAAQKKRDAAVKKAEAALERARRRVAAAEAQLRQTRDQDS
jgi:hypothetical protein